MLGKLIKYDIKSTWRDFAGIYMIIILGVILLPLVLNNISNNIIQLTAGFIAFGICVAVVVITIMNLFKIFNVNIFSKEGYLTMTLPVKAGQIVTSKLLVSSMWILLTGMVCCFGLFLFAVVASPEILKTIFTDFNEFWKVIGGKGAFTLFIFVLAGFITSIKEISKLFLACSIAHLKQLHRFRIPAGIASYFIFSWLETLFVQLIVMFGGDKLDAILNKIEATTNDISAALNVTNGIMGIGMLYTLLFTVLFSFATIWILNHKLELD